MQTIQDVRNLFIQNFDPDRPVQELFGMGFLITDTEIFPCEISPEPHVDPSADMLAQDLQNMGDRALRIGGDAELNVHFYLRGEMLVTVAQCQDEDAIRGFTADLLHVSDMASHVADALDVQPGPIVWQATHLTITPDDYHLIEEALMGQIAETGDEAGSGWGAVVADGTRLQSDVYLNRHINESDQMNHAEIELLGSVGAAALQGKDVWVTSPPCHACLTALAAARVRCVYYAPGPGDGAVDQNAVSLGLTVKRVTM